MQIKQLAQMSLDIQDIISYFRRQDFRHGQRILQKLVRELSAFLSEEGNVLEQDFVSSMVQTLQNILTAQDNNDFVLLADLLEAQLKPFIDSLLQMLVFEDETEPDYLEKNLCTLERNQNYNYKTLIEKIRAHAAKQKETLYTAEQTNLGGYTLKYNGEKTFYYHSNINPVAEGKQFAEAYGKTDMFHYTVFGFGMGYHVRQLLQQDRRYEVHAVENNLEVLTLAFIYCDLEELLSHPRFRLSYCELSEISKMLSQTDTTFLIHYPSLVALEEGVVKNALQNYFIITNTMYAQGHLLDWNFYDSRKLNDRPIDTIKDEFADKSVIYVGGGPSLEYYAEFLREQCNNKEKVVICASTVYKKLLAKDMIPDYVIILDPNDGMVNQIKGTPETKSKMLYLCTACNQAVMEFSGERYVIFQKGYQPAEDYAKEQSLMTFETGGSVSTLAIDVLLQCGCRELLTIGLDLAYTDNKRHSFDAKATETVDLPQVKCVVGGMIPTTNVLNTYRIWIEKRLKDEKDVRLINLSRGAYIEGMENVSSL